MTEKILRWFYRILPFAAITLPGVVHAGTINLGLTPEVTEAIGLSSTDVRVTVARIINVFMGILGIIAVVIVLYGGFLWMTAAGNEEKVEKAKKMLVAGVIGLAIILSAYAIAQFVINSLVSATAQ
ncbi:hypothetical protein A3F28_00220 [Candidatus Uhrbacteria bacterium RIFCSPHIGHO2_12_FULL_57_11]|uniref:TrbC/VIRB2 family protein n=1 Tax=Candidatus Uhrbacteria bacterium RIFCSPHIGHO2_12_FULL_57_11 TaxID=1802398 RepID=A0A1F7UI23_9BACT|nr:MAG: hypothetical protein A3F28_00220 [Candidatus Uhrbacteria bacterium RIFCSPHIGHO2_12_FULL_57_11]